MNAASASKDTLSTVSRTSGQLKASQQDAMSDTQSPPPSQTTVEGRHPLAVEDSIERLRKPCHVQRMHDATPSRLTISPPMRRRADLIGAEIKQNQVPLDYAALLKDCKVLFLGESHDNMPIRPHLAAQAKMLKHAGVTHLAIEASECSKSSFELLNRGLFVDLSKVKTGKSLNMPEMIYAFAAQGVQILPIDIDQSMRKSQEEREARLAANILQVVNKVAGKVAVLIGATHLGKDMGGETIACAEQVAAAGVMIKRVNFAGGSDSTPLDLAESVASVGLQASTFMLDLRRCAHLSIYEGGIDFAIHLPAEEFPSEGTCFWAGKDVIEPLYTSPRIQSTARKSISIEPEPSTTFYSVQSMKVPKFLRGDISASILRETVFNDAKIEQKDLPQD